MLRLYSFRARCRYRSKMKKSRNFLLVLVFCLVGLLMAEDQQREEDQQSQQNTGISTLPIPSDFTLSDTFFRAVGTAGALVTGIAGIAALLSFILPIFGFRTCSLFGNCDNGYDPSVYNPNMAANSVYDQNGFTGYQYGNNAYGKRSLEYVGPILKMLSAAYEKYGPKARPAKPPATAEPH